MHPPDDFSLELRWRLIRKKSTLPQAKSLSSRHWWLNAARTSHTPQWLYDSRLTSTQFGTIKKGWLNDTKRPNRIVKCGFPLSANTFSFVEGGLLFKNFYASMWSHFGVFTPIMEAEARRAPYSRIFSSYRNEILSLLAANTCDHK